MDNECESYGTVVSEDLGIGICTWAVHHHKIWNCTCWIVKYPMNQRKQVHTSRTSDGTWCGTKRCWGFHANRLGIIYVNVTVCRTFHTFKQTGAVST